MIELNTLIADARRAYRKSGVKLHLPQSPYIPSGPEYVRPSSLGRCELLHAYEKLGIESDYPELEIEHNPDKEWITDHGNYVAPMIQEPLMFWAMTHEGYSFVPEQPVISDKYHVAGRIDGMLTVNGEAVILEIKDTEGVEKRSIGQPSLPYALQALCYLMVKGTSLASIITVSKWGWNTYPLVPKDGGFEIQDAWGHRWQEPEYLLRKGHGFNIPEILSFETVEREIDTMRRTLSRVRQSQADTSGFVRMPDAPIQDPLNHPQGFLCFSHTVKPTKTKTGIATPNCPFIQSCHGASNVEQNTIKTDEGYAFEGLR